jgi:hypothetical protein
MLNTGWMLFCGAVFYVAIAFVFLCVLGFNSFNGRRVTGTCQPKATDETCGGDSGH